MAEETVELTTGISLYYSKGRDDVPKNAIKTGLSPCGQVYVGIIRHEMDVMPCKIIPAYNLCYYPYNGREYNTKQKTYLVTDPGYTYKWVTKINSKMPDNAVIIAADDNEAYHVGRVTMDGEKVVGKIIASKQICLVPKCGKEFIHTTYDVLCLEENS